MSMEEKSAVLHAEEATFKDLVEDHKGVVLVDFWGTGCPPCHQLLTSCL